MIWVLTGFMGCGKTSIGRLAASLSSGLEFIDLDEEIVRREGRSIPDIFSADGETVFRSIERRTLADLLHAAGVPPEGRNTRGSIAGGPSRREGGVSEANSRRGNAPLQSSILISLGGGTLTDAESRKLVRENCKCIYLRASLETLAENLREAGTEGRPMLKLAPGESLEDRIRNLMAERREVYESCADFIIDIDRLDYPAIARQILNSFGQ